MHQHVESIGQKLERAEKHLAELDELVRGVWEASPFEIVVIDDVDDPSRVCFCLKERQPFPASKVALVVGDLAHNLRAVLDHLACHLVAIEGGPSAISGSTAFPIWRKPTKPTPSQLKSLVLDKLKGRCDAALEIGTGTGAFLERLKDAGFKTLVGIEPSVAAIKAAPAHRKDWIVEGIFEADMYPPASFDLITCFMTLEHVQDPGALVAAAHKMLRPGGVFVAVTHDYRGWLNRLLGKRSPIIDIEHMQLFSAQSSEQLLALRGYGDVGTRQFQNAYRPSYWLRLVPIPTALKSAAIAVVKRTPFDRFRIAFNVGNTMSWGVRTA